jgi:acyl-CoA thioesterase-1
VLKSVTTGQFASVLVACALLSACNSEAPPAPQPSNSASPVAEIPVMGPERRILAIGDSLFAGYGLNPGEAYPERLETALRAKGVNARITNAGVSGDTSAAGRQRLSFVLDSQPQPPELVIVEFGGNDVLRGLPPEETRANLDAMLAELKRRKLPVLLMGMLAAPNLGEDFRAKFDPIYPALARKYDAQLVPFFLQPVMGKPDLIQRDHLHPTARGVEDIVAATSADVAKALPSAK